MSDKMLFLSNSIEDTTSDLIGFDTYVNKLDDAIEEGAQMIAVTSPFGSGKTSIIELLKKKRSKRMREKFLSVQMWSQLNKASEEGDKTCELHKNFLYQIGSAIDPRKGTYINRRLSNNYGLLKLHINKPLYWVYLILAMLFAAAAWLSKEYGDTVAAIWTEISEVVVHLPLLMSILSILFFALVIAGAEVIFSSRNSENQRVIEADEIIDLYRDEIINKKGKIISFLCNILKKIPLIKKIPFLSGKRYIIVIEDLDRTDDNEAVIYFLKELRKYYLISDDTAHQNSVIFIVNIKPETGVINQSLSKEMAVDNESIKDNEAYSGEDAEKNTCTINNQGLLYAKLFDYVINVQTINVLDYDAILSALLLEKKTCLEGYKLNSTTDNLSDIPGMQWIIRGQCLDIRKIKKRLNYAIVIFETLRERYPQNKTSVNFEKCAAASYLTTEFEWDFMHTPDVAFGSLIELNLQKKLTQATIKKVLETKNDVYVNVINDLISSQLIGEDYRLYFYNYPKNSVMYNNDELMVQNAILYGTPCEDLEEKARKVVGSNSLVVKESLRKLCQLKLPLPQTVINTECLFLATLQYEYDKIIEMFSKMNSDDASLDKNIAVIVNVLNFDKERKIYNDSILSDFCGAWENNFDEKYLLQLREVICSKFSGEILSFKQLFFGSHNVISQKEMDLLSFHDALELINVDSNNFSISHIKYITDTYRNLSTSTELLSKKIREILIAAIKLFNAGDIALFLIEYMLKVSSIVPEFEIIIYRLLILENEELDEYNLDSNQQGALFEKYQTMVNSVSIDSISLDVLQHISEFDGFDDLFNYSKDISNKLYCSGYYFEATFVKLRNGDCIDFNDENLISGFKSNLDWLEDHSKAFLEFRKELLIKTNNLANYLFLFGSRFPILSKEDFVLLSNNSSVNVSNVISFFPVDNMTIHAVEYITRYLNKGRINNNEAFDIIVSLQKFTDEIILAFFEKIDFSRSFAYYAFSAEKKRNIKRIFADALELDTYDGKIRFMEITRFLDDEYEQALEDQMDSEMEKTYVGVIRKRLGPTSVNDATIRNLLSFNKYYPFADATGINQKMLEQKEYIYYVVSTTLQNKKFNMASEDLISDIWPTYMELFTNPSKFSQTVGYMRENQDFLKLIVAKVEYTSFTDSVLEVFASTTQDAKLVAHVFTKGNAFAIKYFATLKMGFANASAARTFVECIGQASNKNVAKNDSVRDRVYDMLISPQLKGKYTKVRKLYGCDY